MSDQQLSTGVRRALLIAGVGLGVPALAMTCVRLIPVQMPTPLVQLVSFAPYLVLPLAIAFMAALALRQRLAAGLLAAAMLLQLLWLVPTFGAGQSTDAGQATGGEQLQVMSLNALHGGADAADVVRTVEEAGVDLLVIVEFSEALSERLNRAGLNELLPFAERRAERGPGGSAIYARYPLENVRALPQTSFSMQQATVHLAGASGATVLTITAVHTYPPFPGRVADWTADFEALAESVGGAGPHLYLGDFNATLDHWTYRQFLERPGPDLVDAAEHFGARLRPTWPAGARIPAVLTLDHIVLSSHISLHSYDIRRIASTDHKAVLATIGVPAVP